MFLLLNLLFLCLCEYDIMSDFPRFIFLVFCGNSVQLFFIRKGEQMDMFLFIESILNKSTCTCCGLKDMVCVFVSLF